MHCNALQGLSRDVTRYNADYLAFPRNASRGRTCGLETSILVERSRRQSEDRVSLTAGQYSFLCIDVAERCRDVAEQRRDVASVRPEGSA